MKVFITGASGFIGSHVAHRLLDAGHELVALVRDPGKLPWLADQPNVQIVHAGLADADALRRGVQGCGACIHVALGWGDNPAAMLEADTRPAVTLLEACLEAGVEKFIHTSSTAAVGAFPSNIDERVRLSPDNLYGATKAAAEAYVLGVEAESTMQCNIIRPGYTFGNPVVDGATTQPDRRFHAIARRARDNRPIEVQAGDGTQFIWAGDLARIYEGVLNAERSRQIYFGLGRAFVTWERIAREAVAMAGSNSAVHVTGEPGPPSVFDVSKLDAHFGLKPEAYPHISRHLEYLIQEKG
jgi:UDP-glucose 4-epimerase